METESPEKSSPEKKLKKEIESPKKSSSEKEQKKNEVPAAKKKEISPKKEKKTEVKPPETPETPETSKSESSPTETQSAKKKKKKNKKKNKENETNTTNAPAENEQKTGQDKTPLGTYDVIQFRKSKTTEMYRWRNLNLLKVFSWKVVITCVFNSMLLTQMKDA